jgi:hypothetical protein
LKEDELAEIVADFREESTIDPPMEIEIQKRFESQFV